eukprot:TRINITY_DN67505_c0_g1_i1.p1 TRINITY_DN67505_c0_g1~~TRINITY_DN67505_c0_g1_i1.p1  ORF type:complete len:326 (+),score=42.93 TRINITY_DN67505_c0_g1_i1:94-1071(+)
MAFTESFNRLWQHGMRKEEACKGSDTARRKWEREQRKKWGEENRAAIRSHWKNRRPNHWGSTADTLGTMAVNAALADMRSVSTEMRSGRAAAEADAIDTKAQTWHGGEAVSSFGGTLSRSASVGTTLQRRCDTDQRQKHGIQPVPPTPAGQVPNFPRSTMSHQASPISRLRRTVTAPSGLAATGSSADAWSSPVYVSSKAGFDAASTPKPNEYVPVVDGSVSFKPVPGVRFGTPQERLGGRYIATQAVGPFVMWVDGVSHRKKTPVKRDVKDDDDTSSLKERQASADLMRRTAVPSTHSPFCGPQCYCMKYSEAPFIGKVTKRPS